MAEVNQEVAANKPNKPAGAPEVQQCDDMADPAAEYMEVGGAAVAWVDKQGLGTGLQFELRGRCRVVVMSSVLVFGEVR